MKLENFKTQVQNYPLFRSVMFRHFTTNVPLLRRQISEWQRKGYILELKRGVYTLPDKDRARGVSRFFLASQLYQPSYISLETALSYYGMIPERVPILTSVSSKKTQSFTNSFGTFIYHHIKPIYYDHFIKKTDEFDNSFFIATPERALIDYFYLKMHDVYQYNDDVFDLSLRLQNLEQINRDKLAAIADKFNSRKINYLLTLFNQYLDNLT